MLVLDTQMWGRGYSLGRVCLFSTQRHQCGKPQFQPNERNVSPLLFPYFPLRRYKIIMGMIFFFKSTGK